MSNASSHSFYFSADDSLPEDEESARSTTPGGKEEVQWEVVAQMPGLLPARIVADRLRSEGIPVRFWQESVGQAFGMTVGPLGTGYVAVPEELAERALEILEENDAAAGKLDGTIDNEIW